MRSYTKRTRAVAGLSALALAGSGLFVSSALAGGKDAKSEHWGVVERNTIGSPVAALRDGPYVISKSTNTVSAPPFGKGSLGIEVGSSTEKMGFGDEVDFVGDAVADLNQAGFYVYQTGEDTGYGGDSNLPNIQIEINPHVANKTYTSMVFVPNGSNVTPDEWSGYIDGTDPTQGYWYFSNSSVATATGCTQAGSCTSLQAALDGLATANDGTGPATILAISVAKGRDAQFQGAVDGLRINDRTYDFEADGVHAKGAK